MHEVLRSKTQNPSQKFCNNLFDFEKPQIFHQTPKVEMHEKEGLGSLPSEEKLDLGRKILEEEVWSEWERFWEVKS